jgi:hypothetical protein
MLTNNAYTTTEMQWPNLFNTYQFLKRTDATTADEKIISYLDQQVQKAVESGFATEAELKKRLRTNLVADKKVKFRGQMDKLYLVSLFDEYTKPTGADVRQQYRATASTVKLSKSKWQYTVEELKQLDGDEDFWRSIYNNIASVQSKKPEAFAQYFGTNGYMIAMDAKDYARQRAAACKNKTEVIPTVPVNLSLEEKIAKGIPVVITPDVVRELIKLYPNVTATDTTFGKSDAEAIEADKAAKAAELAAIKEAEAKEKAEAKAERERLAAEARAKRAEAEAKRVEEAKAAAEKAAKRKAIEDALRAKMAEAKAAKTATTTTTEDEGSTDPSPEDKNFDISGDLWAEAVDEENSKPEIIIPPTSPEMIIWERASKLRDEFVRKQTDTICVWDLETEFSIDIDEALEEIVKQYPDNFEYDIESGEIRFFPEEN